MPTCTRRHYQFFAETIRAQRLELADVPSDLERATRHDAIDKMEAELAGRLKRDNPNFNPEMFRKECGYVV